MIRLAAAGAFELDHIGAELGEHGGAEGGGEDLSGVDHEHAVKRGAEVVVGHGARVGDWGCLGVGRGEAGTGLGGGRGGIPAASAGMTDLSRAGVTDLSRVGMTGLFRAGVTDLSRVGVTDLSRAGVTEGGARGGVGAVEVRRWDAVDSARAEGERERGLEVGAAGYPRQARV